MDFPYFLLLLAGIVAGGFLGYDIGQSDQEDTLNSIDRTWNIGFQEGVVCGGDYRPENVTVEDCITIVRYNGNYVETMRK